MQRDTCLCGDAVYRTSAEVVNSSGAALGATVTAPDATPDDELNLETAIRADLLSRPGVAGARLLGPFTVLAYRADQQLFFNIENLSSVPNDFTVTITSDLLLAPVTEHVSVGGSTDMPLTHTRLSVPVRSDLPPGMYEMPVSVEGPGDTTTDIFYMEVYDPTDQEIAALRDLLDSGALVLPDPVAAQTRALLAGSPGPASTPAPSAEPTATPSATPSATPPPSSSSASANPTASTSPGSSPSVASNGPRPTTGLDAGLVGLVGAIALLATLTGLALVRRARNGR